MRYSVVRIFQRLQQITKICRFNPLDQSLFYMRYAFLIFQNLLLQKQLLKVHDLKVKKSTSSRCTSVQKKVQQQQKTRISTYKNMNYCWYYNRFQPFYFFDPTIAYRMMQHNDFVLAGCRNLSDFVKYISLSRSFVKHFFFKLTLVVHSSNTSHLTLCMSVITLLP